MLSAGFEHGGNVVHRHLDGHPDLLVYPFESQLGNKDFNDFLATVERVQYRYPEFPEGLSSRELYEQIFDEEMKTYLRKGAGSKFRDVDLQLDEKRRIKEFQQQLGQPPWLRRQIIEAFFRATFQAWENHHIKPREDMKYVGYSPAIGLDADRILQDFPNLKMIHIVRNPFAAYRDTKRRPFPHSLKRFLITWNLYHSTVLMYARQYPHHIRLFRYEDLVRDKKCFMMELADFMSIRFTDNMLYPSWNGTAITGDIAPWGTVLRDTEDYNKSVVHELSGKEKRWIVQATGVLARHFQYHQIDYLRPLFATEADMEDTP